MLTSKNPQAHATNFARRFAWILILFLTVVFGSHKPASAVERANAIYTDDTLFLPVAYVSDAFSRIGNGYEGLSQDAKTGVIVLEGPSQVLAFKAGQRKWLQGESMHELEDTKTAPFVRKGVTYFYAAAILPVLELETNYFDDMNEGNNSLSLWSRFDSMVKIRLKVEIEEPQPEPSASITKPRAVRAADGTLFLPVEYMAGVFADSVGKRSYGTNEEYEDLEITLKSNSPLVGNSVFSINLKSIPTWSKGDVNFNYRDSVGQFMRDGVIYCDADSFVEFLNLRMGTGAGGSFVRFVGKKNGQMAEVSFNVDVSPKDKSTSYVKLENKLVPGLQRGDSGPTVKQWQVFLNALGFGTPMNGKFDASTTQATLEYQKHHNIAAIKDDKLTESGIVDFSTLRDAKDQGFGSASGAIIRKYTKYNRKDMLRVWNNTAFVAKDVITIQGRGDGGDTWSYKITSLKSGSYIDIPLSAFKNSDERFEFGKGYAGKDGSITKVWTYVDVNGGKELVFCSWETFDTPNKNK